jgi:VWFA-related protein
MMENEMSNPARLFAVVLALSVTLSIAAQEGSTEAETTVALETVDSESEPLPVFRGELDVNLVNLFVTVLDDDGRPVNGLTAQDFKVFEDGKPVEVTNFEAIQRENAGPVRAGEMEVRAESVPEPRSAGVPDPQSAGVTEHGRFVALVFDVTSLEKRGLRKIVKSLEGFVRDGLGQDDQIMIARVGGYLEIVRPFSDNEPALIAALNGVGDLASAGDSLKRRKRALKRSVHTSDMYRVMPTGQLDVAFTQSQISRWKTEIEAIRRQEYDRIRQTLGAVDELLRALAGIKGRKSVVLVGQDLAIRPVLDIYSVFYGKAAFVGEQYHLTRPEMWGEELKLDREFQAIAAAAQASGTTFYVIDASDRDREMATADFGSASALSVFAAEASGENWSPGADMAEQREKTEGAHYMALSSGGAAYGNTRKMDNVVDSLSAQVASYYYIGYRRPGPPDGQRHNVQVKVQGKGLRVRHHEKVLNRTAPQRLADLAYSRLRLDAGANPLGLEVSLGEPEPADRGRFIQPLRLNMPVDKLVLLPDATNHVGQILVAVVALDGDGFTAPPQLLRLRLRIPSDQFANDKIATQRIRLLMRDGTSRIAVSVRDEVSGLEASQSIAVPVEEL